MCGALEALLRLALMYVLSHVGSKEFGYHLDITRKVRTQRCRHRLGSATHYHNDKSNWENQEKADLFFGYCTSCAYMPMN